jgi:hypothetical protein
MEPVLDDVARDSEYEDPGEPPPWYRFAGPMPAAPQNGVAVARLAGFDLQEQPLLAELACMAGQVVPAQAAVALRRDMVGARVVVVFDGGLPERPIILGVILDRTGEAPCHPVPMPLQAEVDGERIVIQAERELVLRCGDASITLTRAGKILLRGNYILSRSTGYNKIKGAAVDIN